MALFDATSLTTFTCTLFQAAGVPADEADTVATSLVESNLRGHDSHGVMRVVDYVNQLNTGELQVGVELKTLSETASILACDGQLGFGQVQCRRLMERLITKARQQGVASGTMQKSGHVGRLGEWVEQAATADLSALVTVNDNGSFYCVAPVGGKEARISTNPLAISVPTSEGPLVLDMSTSIVANGKVRVAWLAGEHCPPGWLQDADGNPTTDPAVRVRKPFGNILPLGGEQAGFKGFGLGLLLDILAGGLSGGFCPPQDDAPSCNNVLAVVWDPARFAGSEHFLAQADKLIESIRTVTRKPGVDKIRLPGDSSLQVRRARLQQGIPLPGDNWRQLERLAEKLGVAVPQPVG